MVGRDEQLIKWAARCAAAGSAPSSVGGWLAAVVHVRFRFQSTALLPRVAQITPHHPQNAFDHTHPMHRARHQPTHPPTPRDLEEEFPGCKVHPTRATNLEDPKQVAALAQDILNTKMHINIFVANAGGGWGAITHVG
jgi:hypothetical protein